MKKTCVNLRIPLGETMCDLLELWKEKKGRRGQKASLKEIMSENISNLKRDCTSQVHEAKISIQSDLLQHPL